MATNTYERQSSFGNGDVIDAGLFNAEFNQLALVFDQVDGHDHSIDGAGGFVPLIANTTASSFARIDDTDANNHKFIVELDGNPAFSYTEADGFSVTNLAVSITGLEDVADTAVANGYLRWNAAGDGVVFETDIPVASIPALGSPSNGYPKWDTSNFIYSATIPHTDITGLITDNITHNGGPLDVYLDGLEVDVVAAQAAAVAAEASADAAAQAAMDVGVPTFVADGGSFTFLNTTQNGDVVFEGDGTLNLPTVLVKGRRFTARVSLNASNDKLLTVLNPSYTIIGPKATLVPTCDLTLVPGDRVTLEAISTTELEVI